MIVRGAPLIGAAAAYGMALAHGGRAVRCRRSSAPTTCCCATRPTAVNLRWALDDMRALLATAAAGQARATPPIAAPPRSADEDVAICRAHRRERPGR